MGKILDLTKRFGRSAVRGLTPIPAIKQGLAIDQHRQVWTATGRAGGGILAYLRRLHQNRNPNAPGAPDLNDFQQVMEHWGLTEEQLPRVIKELKWSMAAWLCNLLLFNGLLFWTGPRGPITLGIALAVINGVSGLGILTNYYRLQVLTSRRFMFFKDFLLGRAQGGEE